MVAPARKGAVPSFGTENDPPPAEKVTGCMHVAAAAANVSPIVVDPAERVSGPLNMTLPPDTLIEIVSAMLLAASSVCENPSKSMPPLPVALPPVHVPPPLRSNSAPAEKLIVPL